MSNPPRKRGETPPQYFKRTKCCPDDLEVKIRGKYWCNPAHCSASFKTREEQQRHLDAAYALLD